MKTIVLNDFDEIPFLTEGPVFQKHDDSDYGFWGKWVVRLIM